MFTAAPKSTSCDVEVASQQGRRQDAARLRNLRFTGRSLSAPRQCTRTTSGMLELGWIRAWHLTSTTSAPMLNSGYVEALRREAKSDPAANLTFQNWFKIVFLMLFRFGVVLWILSSYLMQEFLCLLYGGVRFNPME